MSAYPIGPSLLAYGSGGFALMIVGETGHQGLSEDIRDHVVFDMARILSQLPEPWAGLCSLAGGADQEFAQQVLTHGGRLRVVVPSRGYETTFATLAERTQYNALLAEAEDIVRLDFPEPSEEAFFAAGKMIVDGSDLLIAVWDGEASRGLGGTADVVSYALSKGKRVEVVWPAGAQR